MTNDHSPDDIATQIAELRRALDDLARMAAQGLPVAEAQATTRERLATLEARAVRVGRDVGGDVVTGAKETGIDQRGQHVERQVNVAHLYEVYLQVPARHP